MRRIILFVMALLVLGTALCDVAWAKTPGFSQLRSADPDPVPIIFAFVGGVVIGGILGYVLARRRSSATK